MITSEDLTNREDGAPLEPLYTLPEAARLAGFRSIDALRMYLSRHPDVAGRRYRRSDGCRMLTEREIRWLRQEAVKGFLA